MWTGVQLQLLFLKNLRESTWSSSMTLMIMNVNGVPHEMIKESTASGSTSARVSESVWVSLSLQRCDKPKIPPAHILLMHNDRKSFKSNEPNEPDLPSWLTLEEVKKKWIHLPFHTHLVHGFKMNLMKYFIKGQT